MADGKDIKDIFKGKGEQRQADQRVWQAMANLDRVATQSLHVPTRVLAGMLLNVKILPLDKGLMPDVKTQHRLAHRLTLASLALTSRSDIEKEVPPEQHEALARIGNHYIGLAKEVVEAHAFTRDSGRNRDFVDSNEYDAYRRLLCTDAFPEQYARANLPPEYVQGVETMADIWTNYLRQGAEKYMQRRDGEEFNPVQYGAEFRLATEGRGPLPQPTNEQLELFRTHLIDEMLRGGRIWLRSPSQPDDTLKEACRAAGIGLAAGLFPMGHSTSYYPDSKIVRHQHGGVLNGESYEMHPSGAKRILQPA